MDVTDIVRRLWRCRYAVAAVLIAAELAASWAWLHAGASEQSTAAVVIVPPTLGDAVSDQNPLLNLDNNLAQLATVLAAAMSSPEVTEELGDNGATAPYTISTVTGTNPSFAQLSPQVVFTVTATSAALAERTSTALVTAAENRLDSLQSDAGAAQASRARLVTVVAPTAAESAGSGRVRAAGAVAVGASVLGLLAVLLADELLTRRRERRDDVRDADDDDDDAAAGRPARGTQNGTPVARGDDHPHRDDRMRYPVSTTPASRVGSSSRSPGSRAPHPPDV